jgi:hypothetical protein
VSPSLGEGEGEEVVIEEEDDDVVIVAVIDKDDESVEVILMPESTPPRSSYKQTTRIWISPQGRPIETLAPREGAKEGGLESLEARFVVWPPPPPPPSSGDSNNAAPAQDPTTVDEKPPLRSHIGGQILHRFTHLVKSSRPGHRLGAWDFPHRP